MSKVTPFLMFNGKQRTHAGAAWGAGEQVWDMRRHHVTRFQCVTRFPLAQWRPGGRGRQTLEGHRREVQTVAWSLSRESNS